MVGKRDTLENRLWAKIDKRSENECWPWLANKNNKGYGMIRAGGKAEKILAHRVSYSLSKGDIPFGSIVMHSCDNPACCNPLHLSLGTMLDNCRDMDKKGRRVTVCNPLNIPPRHIGANHPHAKLTEEQAHEIKHSKESTKFLCNKFELERSTIKRIRSGRGWKHL